MNGHRVCIRFKGWATVRLPTDPDPADEPRGACGYTFAYAGEPDLDRVIRLQPQDEPAHLRPGANWEWGVRVTEVGEIDAQGKTKPLDGVLTGAPVRLNGGAKLENRNWLLTLPGWEPIFPFDLSVGAADELRRSAPLTSDNLPVYQAPTDALMAQGAAGINLETETVGTATGIWDSLGVLRERAQTLAELITAANDKVERTCLQARLKQVEWALNHPYDRRIMARYAVERFSVTMTGTDAVVPADGPLSGLDKGPPWEAAFYLGAWDFDLLAVWFQGALQVPFRAG